MKKQNNVKIAACILCGSSFESVNSVKTCPACSVDLENYEHQIKDFMKDIPRITAAELSSTLDIPMSIIDYLIEDDFFNVMESVVEFKPIRRCKKCGVQITSGRFCQDCLTKNIADQIKSDGALAQLKESQSEIPKFHVAVNKK